MTGQKTELSECSCFLIWNYLDRSLTAFVSSRDCHRINSSIFRIIDTIRFKPHLVEPLNSLLFPGQKLECPNIGDEVKFFIFVESSISGIKIHSTSRLPLPFPSSDFDLRLITRVPDYQRISYFNRKNTDRDWLLCVSRVLQIVSLSVRSFKCWC